MPAYKISNHAKKGEESRHNLVYWQGDDYVGIGPGAHSRLNNQAIHQIYKPDLWLESVENKNTGEQKRKSLNQDERALEIIMMGMRLKEGLEKNKFNTLTGRPLAEYINQENVDFLIENQLLEENQTTLKATPEGLKCLNALLEKILL